MKPEVVDLTRRLVAIPSESGVSNAPVAEELAAVLRSAGFRVETYGQTVTVPGSGEKVNLVAELGTGKRSLVFSGHLDTVPVGDASAWTHDPCGGDGVVDGRIHGRGANDMKGQIAAAVVAAAASEATLGDLRIVLAITSDEEVGHHGVKALCARHVFKDCVGAIVAEPTSMDVYNAHKGGVGVTITTHGIACHSSRPHEGVNAIAHAARFIAALEGDLEEWSAYRHPAFGDEPQTFTVAQIEGGVAANVVPPECRMIASARVLSDDQLGILLRTVDGTITRLTEEDAAAGVPEGRRFRADSRVAIWAPPMITDGQSPWALHVKGIAGQEGDRFAAYGTDGGVLSRIGLPCVIWGPGDIARAHVPDEYITVAELHDGVEQYVRLIASVARSAEGLPALTSTLWSGGE